MNVYFLQYFNKRLTVSNVTSNASSAPLPKNYNFDSWLALLSQLPLLMFTLLNSFLYQWYVNKQLFHVYI